MMRHKLSLNLVKDFIGLLIGWRQRDAQSSTFVLPPTLDQVCKEEMKTLNHNLTTFLLIGVVEEIVDPARGADPLLTIARIPKSRESSLN